MMKKKGFLTGILSLALVFGMALFVGCPADDDDGGGGGGGSNPLLGTWVDVKPTVGVANETIIFTDEAGSLAGTKKAYYSTNLTKENNPVSATNEIPVNGVMYPSTQTGDSLTLTGYTPAAGATPAADVNFTRILPGSSRIGVWYSSSVASGNARYTLLIIRSNGEVYRSVGSANWGIESYILSSDAAGTYIKWGNGAPASYTKDGTDLSIRMPTGGGAVSLVSSTF
ncbi:MAG: hypothetical protein LBT13_01690 [Treponema sp.]|jgi:hypothetical protein|nr:hypothetical protein [Treponema sp.]